MKTIDLIAGARPNFMKIAPTIDALKAAQTRPVVDPFFAYPGVCGHRADAGGVRQGRVDARRRDSNSRLLRLSRRAIGR